MASILVRGSRQTSPWGKLGKMAEPAFPKEYVKDWP